MPRKKTVTRAEIVEAGFIQLITKGPKGFSSRKIAQKLNCSTQPIYLEFKNMEELRQEVFNQFGELVKLIDNFTVENTDPLIAANLKFMVFAEKEEKMFRSLFLLEGQNGKELKAFCRNILLNRLNQSERYKDLDDEMREALLSGTLTVTLGITTMRVNGLSQAKSEAVEKLLEDVVESILKNEHNTVII